MSRFHPDCWQVTPSTPSSHLVVSAQPAMRAPETGSAVRRSPVPGVPLDGGAVARAMAAWGIAALCDGFAMLSLENGACAGEKILMAARHSIPAPSCVSERPHLAMASRSVCKHFGESENSVASCRIVVKVRNCKQPARALLRRIQKLDGRLKCRRVSRSPSRFRLLHSLRPVLRLRKKCTWKTCPWKWKRCLKIQCTQRCRWTDPLAGRAAMPAPECRAAFREAGAW